MALFGIAIMAAPIIGPTLGGWITDNYSWSWIFYMNVPVGIISTGLSYLFIEEPAVKADNKIKKLIILAF